jgi:hypothetical protein
MLASSKAKSTADLEAMGEPAPWLVTRTLAAAVAASFVGIPPAHEDP